MLPAAMTSEVIDRTRCIAYSTDCRNFPFDSVEKTIMSDPMSIATAYLETWNETDGAKRQSLLQKYWADEATYVDPLMSADGPDGISDLVAAVHQRLPGFRITLTGTPNGHGKYVRLSWSLGLDGAEPPIEGSDVVMVGEGRISQVIGFIDRAPAGA